MGKEFKKGAVPGSDGQGQGSCFPRLCSDPCLRTETNWMWGAHGSSREGFCNAHGGGVSMCLRHAGR